MRLAFFAVGLMVIVAVGLYIGLLGFQQYAVVNSRSLAGSAICAPDHASVAVGQTVTFSLSQVDAASAIHWSSDEGRSQVAPNGTFWVTFTTKGAKAVSAFALFGDTWSRITCSVTVH